MQYAQPKALLSAEELKTLLREHANLDVSPDEAKRIIKGMTRLYLLCETAGRKPRPDAQTRMPGRPTTQRELETEATLALRTLQEHLAHVQQRPSTWRWAIVSLHSALKYSLQAKLVAAGSTAAWSEDVPTLFRRVNDLMPELPQVGEAIAQLDHLRWKYLSKQLSLWPVQRRCLPALCRDVLRLMRRLRGHEGHLVIQTADARLLEMAESA